MPKLSPEQQLKQMEHVCDVIDNPDNHERHAAIEKIRMRILAGLYAVVEEFDDEYGNKIIAEISPQIDSLAREPQISIVDFHKTLGTLARRYKNKEKFQATLPYRTAVKILTESIGKRLANLEIEAFFHAHREHFDLAPDTLRSSEIEILDKEPVSETRKIS